MKLPAITLSGLSALALLIGLSACLPTYNRVPTVGKPQPSPSGSSAASPKDSFQASDLSGCWSKIQIEPVSAARVTGVIFTKTGENTYSFADGVNTTVTIDGDKATFVADGKTFVGKAQLTTYPYQLIRPASEGPEPTQRGYQWDGKTCI